MNSGDRTEAFFVSLGEPQASDDSLSNRCPFLFVIPSAAGFPTSQLSSTTTYAVLRKENHTRLTEAATLDRKSGAAEGSAVSLQVYSHPLLRANRAASMRLAAPNLLIASDK
jgi:hypothetical protein